MNKFLVYIQTFLVISLFLCNSLFSQSITRETNTNKFNISNYVGLATNESEVTYYISLTRKIADKFAIGLKGGIYNYDISLDEAYTKAFEQLYNASSSNPGFYSVMRAPVVKQNFTYIGSVVGEYYYKKNLSLEFSIGLKYYLQKTYAANIDWSVPYSNAPIPEINISPLSQIYIYEQKDIFKPYYSAGINYIVNNFKIGVFGDNIFSVGVNFGVLF